MRRIDFLLIFILLCFMIPGIQAQYPVFTGCPATVDFSKVLRDWDGFGFNYVETAQTIDYETDAKDYGGFSIMTTHSRNEIIDLVFGENGLKVGLMKMFLDPFHQNNPEGKYNHVSSTSNMMMFVRMGLEKTHSWGGNLQIITTLYGPPAYMTLQKVMRGRDLDPAHKNDLAEYLIDWVKFLKEKEKFPVKYISLHNEGEDWERWPLDGKEGNIGKGHDYNMFWPPSQVCEFLAFMQPKLDKAGLNDIRVTNGEPTNWYRFSFWGLPEEIAANPAALKNLGIITSHGFYAGGYDNRWYGSHTNVGISYLRSLRPELHAWVTSTSWSRMDAKFIKEIWGNIYEVQVNGIIPWAGIQRPPLWVGGDPNPGCAIRVSDDGKYEIQPGYYFYKQVSRAGQPGMKVVWTMSMDNELPVIAFASNGTMNKDAFIVVNTSASIEKQVDLTIKGAKSTKFRIFRTNSKDEKYTDLGEVSSAEGKLLYNAPPNSVTTFFSE